MKFGNQNSTRVYEISVTKLSSEFMRCLVTKITREFMRFGNQNNTRVYDILVPNCNKSNILLLIT